MKRLTIVAFMVLVSLFSFAQDDVNYSMEIYLNDGTSVSYEVAGVDSIVYREITDNASDEATDGTTDETTETKNLINGYEYVDLGLSVKWATCNVGADSPEDYGNYYSWGETYTKSNYSSSTCITWGRSMSDISGSNTYDAATVNWGSSWRMPTYDEMTELKTKCTWTWTTFNNVNGYLVTGSNGNSIFLPAAGCYKYFESSGTSLYYAGTIGVYWTSTPSRESDSNKNYQAYYLEITSNHYSMYLFNRDDGQTVRPVTD